MTIGMWPCFVISGSASRLATFQERLPVPWPWSRPVYYRAVWGPHTGKPAAFGGPPGAWGCWRTHARLWEDVFSQVLPGAIVLEDDCTFAGRGEAWAAAAAEFVAALPADWDLAYLGGQHLLPPLPVAPGLQKGVDVNRTHAYLVRSTPRTQAAYWRLCEMRASTGRRPHVDYVLGELQKTGALTAYCPPRWLCGQAAGVSSITGKKCEERYF